MRGPISASSSRSSARSAFSDSPSLTQANARTNAENYFTGTPDPVIAAHSDQAHAIVVTWNHKDFKKLAARVSEPGRRYLRGLGRITIRCSEPEGKKRALEVVEMIELHYELAQRRRDKRLLLKVTSNTFVVR